MASCIITLALKIWWSIWRLIPSVGIISAFRRMYGLNIITSSVIELCALDVPVVRTF
jgi:hypothetical protein